MGGWHAPQSGRAGRITLTALSIRVGPEATRDNVGDSRPQIGGCRKRRLSVGRTAAHFVGAPAAPVASPRSWTAASSLSASVGLYARRQASPQVTLDFASELCHIPHETREQHHHLRGHADAHRCRETSLIGSALVEFSVPRQARAESISKRDPSTARQHRPRQMRHTRHPPAPNAPEVVRS
jgi:hypothetical protein